MKDLTRKKQADERFPFNIFGELDFDLDRFFRYPLLRSSLSRDVFGSHHMPAIDIYDDEDEITVKADIPGMEKDNIKVALNDNLLTIKGERTENKENKKKGYYHMERSYGSFQRTVSLPSEIDTNSIKASYKNGVLEVKLPKTEKSGPKEIEVDIE